MTDHYTEATRLIDNMRDLEGHNADFDMALAQVHATLAIAEQQRIANLIALGDMTTPRAETQITADARDALTVYHQHDDETLGGWTELHPEVARALRIETP